MNQIKGVISMQHASTECITTNEANEFNITEEITNKGEDNKVEGTSTEYGFMRGYATFARFLGLNTHNYSKLASLLNSGNLKLPKTTAIFNMGSGTDCPSFKLGLCQAIINGKKICYACKAEGTIYPNVLPFRRKQEAYWKKTTAEGFALAFLTYNAIKVTPFTALRFNESGDFWGQSCLNKAEKIARLLKPYGIRVYCYTARKDLDYSHIEALKVSGSGWMNEYVRSEFKLILNKKDRPSGYGLCLGDCRICNRCLKGGLKTAILRH